MYERPTFDVRDYEIVAARLGKWNEREGARVGDFVQMLDGTTRRFTHDWDDGLQTSCKDSCGCFYFGTGHGGGSYMSYSGSLDPTIPRKSLVDLKMWKDGSVWIFHHDHWGANRGVYTLVPLRVFKQT